MIIIHKVITEKDKHSKTDSYGDGCFVRCPNCDEIQEVPGSHFDGPSIGTAITCDCGTTSKLIDFDLDEADRPCWHWRVQCQSNTAEVG